MIPPETLSPIPKLRAGDTGWVMENDKPIQVTILQVKVTFAAGSDDPDKWFRHEQYMSLRPNYDRTRDEEKWFLSDKIHATKEALLASL